MFGRAVKNKKSAIKVTKDGPYIVSGGLPLAKQTIVKDREGFSVAFKDGEKYKTQENYALCRCGKSRNKPHCDSTHIKIHFNGNETAGREEYSVMARRIEGPGLTLTDAKELCFGAGFCYSKKGNVWELTKDSSNRKSKELAIKEACNCPSGRLVAWDKKGKPIEPKLRKSISLLEEPGKGVSGPIWVKGGVPIESSYGALYETRNRVTLCRCGQSRNKPFCDGAHVITGFSDSK
jgi:CDGSH-type Zn-finger protein